MNPTLARLANALSNSQLLSQWENGFVESLQEQFNKHGKLSPRQLEILERIEKQKLSEEARGARSLWKSSYDAEKRRVARICAEYYKSAGYFTVLAEVGSLVAFRATADWAHRVAAGDKPCVVISAGGPVLHAAKGSKPYMVLPYAAIKPVMCQERHIKKYKKSKKNKKVVDKSVPF